MIKLIGLYLLREFYITQIVIIDIAKSIIQSIANESDPRI